MRRKQRFKRLIVVLPVALLAYVALCWYLAGQYLSPPRYHAGVTPGFVDDVKVVTRGGPNPTWVSKNFAWAKTVFVLVFGNGGIRGSFTDLARDLVRLGDATVIPSMPGQDESPETAIGFGVAESRTIEDTVAWVHIRRPDRPRIILLGVSMGGAGCWLAAAHHPDVDGIVTESAYAQLAPTVSRFFNRAIPGGSIIFRPVVWIAQWRSGLKVADINPVLAARAWHGRPALVIHAGEDSLVDVGQGRELAAATGADLWIVNGAPHAGCYDQNPKAYVTRLQAFGKGLRAQER